MVFMKTFNKIACIVLAAMAIVSCSRHDIFDDLTITGAVGPQAYWEVESGVVSAGNNLGFTAQYYTSLKDENGKYVAIDHSEVWYNLVENLEKTVSSPWATTFTYSISTNTKEEKRISQLIKKYAHDETYWNDSLHAYTFTDNFPTSSTLSPVTWKTPAEFDSTKMVQYFGDGFMQNFKDSLYTMLKFADWKNMLIKLTYIDDFRPFTDSTYNETASKNQGTDVYDYHFPNHQIPDTIQQIWDQMGFDELIQNTTNNCYDVEYSRSYKIDAILRVYDVKGTYGATVAKEIELN